MKHTESTDRAVFWAAPVLLGLLLIFGGILAGAGLLASGRLGVRQETMAVCIPLIAGTAAASFWGARRAPGHRLPMGLLTGMLLLGCLFLLGLTLRDAAFQAPAAGIISGIVLLSSLAGAVPGAAVQTKKRRR